MHSEQGTKRKSLSHAGRHKASVAGQIGHEVRSLRMMGSAALALASVTTGRLDEYANFTLGPWDWAAGKLLIEEADGRVDILSDDAASFPEVATAFAAAEPLFTPLRSIVLAAADRDVIMGGASG